MDEEKRRRLDGIKQFYDGDTVSFDWQGTYHLFECCDCGLVHRLEFHVKGKRIFMTVSRDEEATAYLRSKASA